MAAALPKVASYVKNVGKSVAFSTVDYLKDLAPTSASFVETNQEVFKAVSASVRDYKGTIKKADDAWKKSKVFEALSEGKKALFEDLKSGNWYNADRIAQFELRAAGDTDLMGDDWSFDDFDDSDKDPWDIDDDDDDLGDSDKVAKATVKSSKVMTKKLGSAIDESIKANAKITIKSTGLVVDTITKTSGLLYTQAEKINTSMVSGMTSIKEEIGKIAGFVVGGALETHINNSARFYTDTLKNVQEINALLKESVEMQRNLYKKEEKNVEWDYDNIVDSAGNVDIGEYAKVIKKNFKHALPSELQMIFGDAMGKDSNMLLAFAGSPLQYVLGAIPKLLIGGTLKKSIASLDKTLSAIFPSLLARFNAMANEDNDNSLVGQFFGKLFGVKLNKKSTINTSNYKKDAVPFDGITRKAIIEVIPGYLARIESALTSKEERIYDYDSGKWSDIKTIQNNFIRSKRAAIYSGTDEAMEEVDKHIRELAKVSGPSAASLRRQVDNMRRKIWTDDGYFRPYSVHGNKKDDTMQEEAYAYYGFDNEDDFKRIVNLMMKNRKALMSMAADTMESKERYARSLEMAESGISPYQWLFNGAFPNAKTYSTTETDKDKLISTASGFIGREVDSYNKNIFFYLRGIYSELIYQRNRLPIQMSGGRKKKKKGIPPSGPSNQSVDPMKDLNLRLEGEKARLDYERRSKDPDHIEADNFDEDEWNKIQDEQRIADEEIERLKNVKDKEEDKPFLRDFLESKGFYKKFLSLKGGIQEWFKAPTKILAKWMDTADRKIFDMLFGKEGDNRPKDSKGRDIKGLFNYVVLRTEEIFDNLKDWMKEHIFDPINDWFKKTKAYNQFQKLKEKVKNSDIVRNVSFALKRKGINIFNTVKDATSNTYGKAFDHATGLSHEEILRGAVDALNENRSNGEDGIAETQPIGEDNTPVVNSARGRIVTKRGLTMISPGEIIIPASFNRKVQNKQLAKEKAMKNRFFPGLRTMFNATGTVTDTVDRDTNGEVTAGSNEDKKAVESTLRKVLHEISPDSADIIADSLIGGGISLITGMVGGPLLGAATGAAYGIIKNSETVQKWLFGEDSGQVDKDGNPIKKGGLISDKTQKTIMKYFPDIRDFGIAGAIGGLFTPLGVIGGMFTGAGIGFLKNNESFQNWLFGPKNKKTGERDGGLISKEFKEKLKKGSKNIATGAIAGALLGPFGLLGNVALGSALGFVSSTDKFHEVIFGKEDGNGGKKGGLVNAMKHGVVDPLLAFGKIIIADMKDFVHKKVISPLKDFIKPVGQMIKNGITNIGDFAKDTLKSIFDNTIGRPLEDTFVHGILEPIGRKIKKILKFPTKLLKGLISAPFAALGAIGKNITASQIKKGTAHNMTASERMQFRKKHFLRMALNDHTIVSDNQIAELAASEGGIDKLKDLRDQISLFEGAMGDLGTKGARIMKDVSEKISDYLNTTYPDGSIYSLYTLIRASQVKSLLKAIRSGDLEKANRIIFNMPALVRKRGFEMADQDVQALIEMIQQPTLDIKDLIEKKKEQKKDVKGTYRELSRLTRGGIKDRKSMRRYLRNLNYEIDAKEINEAKANAEGEEADSEPINTMLDRKTTEIITVLQEINNSIKSLKNGNVNPDGSSAISPGDPDAASKAKEMNNNKQAVKNADNIGKTSVGSNNGIAGGPAAGLSNTVDKANAIIAEKKMDQGLEKQTLHGVTALVDSSGKAIKGKFKNLFNKLRKKDNKSEEEQKSFREMLHDSFIGKAMGKAKDTLKSFRENGGIIGALGSITNVIKLSPVGRVLGIIGNVGKFIIKGLLVASLIGHFSEFWKQTLWPKFIQPAFKKITSVVGGIASNILTGLTNWLGEDHPIVKGLSKVGEFFTSFIEKPAETIKTMILKPMWNFFVDGLDKFNKNILTPVLDIIMPKLASTIWKTVKNIFSGGTLADLMNDVKHEGSDVVTNQIKDENGRDLYIDKNGNTTTDKYYRDENGELRENEAYTHTTVVNTDSGTERKLFGKDVDFIRKRAKDQYGHNFTYLEYSNGTIVIRSEDTQEYVRLNGGPDTCTEIVYGRLTDRNGNPSNGSIIGGGLIGGAIGGIAGAAIAGAATGAAAGTIIPGIGNVVGMAVGAVAGVAGAYIMYALEGGGYSMEEKFAANSDDANILLLSFGFEKGKAWPQFHEVSNSAARNLGDTGSFKVNNTNTGTLKSTKMIGGTSFSGLNNVPNPGDTYLYYNGYEKKVKSETFTNSKRELFDYYQKYTDSEGRTVYYDTRANYSFIPPEIQSMVSKNDWEMNRDDPSKTASYPTNSGSGRGHAYQRAANIVNAKFGKSTIGESGCGPVTAVNMINRLSGHGRNDILNAAQFAERGGYIDSTGGTTTDYIQDYLGANGYMSTQTNDKNAILSGLKNGRPAVLLGNSNDPSISSPFGSTNHYINAYGMDKNGNIITEDPDLPSGMRSYPANRLMRDTKIGVVTGSGRDNVKFKPIFKSKFRGSGKAKTMTISNLTRIAYQIIQTFESGGGYASINKNDNGAMSIGKIQWHGINAKKLLQAIANLMGSNPGISSSLWNDIVGNSDWRRRKCAENEVSDIKKLLDSKEGHEVQDTMAIERIQSSVDWVKKAGVTDPKAIVYFADCYNIGPSASMNIINSLKASKSAASITMEDIHNGTKGTSLGASQYISRRDKVYAMIKGMDIVDGTTTINVADISTMTETDSQSAESTGLFSAITNTAASMMKAIFGEDLYNSLFGLNSDAAGGSTGDYPGANAPISDKQTALVQKMRSIEGQIKYSTSGVQDPDKGTASCASTVSWAYRKVFGDNEGNFESNQMSASSTTQAKDSRFTTIWANDGSSTLDINKLQPGDVIYTNWYQNKNNGSMNHTEMYAGDGVDLSHGNPNALGPTTRKIDDYRKRHTMLVRRYNGFLDNSGSGRNSAYDSSMQMISDVNKGYDYRYNGYSRNRSASARAITDYDTLLNTIVSILVTIANNTQALNQILDILSKSGIKIDRTAVQNAAASSRSAKARIRELVESANKAAGKGRNDFNAVDSAGTLLDNESTAYIVQVMEALASK